MCALEFVDQRAGIGDRQVVGTLYVEAILHQPPHVDAVAAGDGVNRFDLRTGRLSWAVAVGGLTLAITISSVVIGDTVLVESATVSVVVITSMAVVPGGLLAVRVSVCAPQSPSGGSWAFFLLLPPPTPADRPSVMAQRLSTMPLWPPEVYSEI